MKKIKGVILPIIILLSALLIPLLREKGLFNRADNEGISTVQSSNDGEFKEIEGFIEKVNNNEPYFTEEEKNRIGYEYYSELDALGRCGVCFAVIGKETIPTEERGEIGNIKPSGWKQAKYPGVIDSDPAYLYNRCHLIAYCLTGENANEKNLITGTRYFNVNGMLPFETIVAKYMDKNPDNHVLYRVTPYYEGDELVARYVTMEAYSIEDNGTLSFNAKVMNIQPGVNINYSTGESSLPTETVQ